MATTAHHPVIADWSTISPVGNDKEAFADALRRPPAGARPLPDDLAVPLPAAHTVADFDTVRFLGSKGTRSLDRLSAMVIATARMVLERDGSLVERDPGAIGLVLASSAGSIASIADFIRDTIEQEKPYLVNPSLFPNTVMNCAAGQTAIWQGLKGVNSTISGGQLSALLALRYAVRMIATGRADTLLVGGVEELSVPIAWAAHHLRDGETGLSRPPGEGCAMFVVHHPEVAAASGAPVLGELLAFEFRVEPGQAPAGVRAALATCIRGALGQAGASAGDVGMVSASQCGSCALDEAELAAIDDVLPATTSLRRPAVADHVGNCFSASGAFQLAAVLATCDAAPAASRLALLTSVGDGGAVGCALVRC